MKLSGSSPGCKRGDRGAVDKDQPGCSASTRCWSILTQLAHVMAMVFSMPSQKAIFGEDNDFKTYGGTRCM